MSTTTWKLILFLIFTGAVLQAQTPVKIALFDTPVDTTHGDQIFKFLKSKIKNCKTCSIRRYEFFNSEGKVDTKKFLNHLQSLPADIQILHLSWNVPYENKYESIITELNKKISQGLIVIAASGESQNPSEINLELKETVMGKVNGARLIGELNSKGRLNLNAYYGPEIAKSYLSIQGHPGSSFTSLIETSKVASDLASQSKK